MKSLQANYYQTTGTRQQNDSLGGLSRSSDIVNYPEINSFIIIIKQQLHINISASAVTFINSKQTL